MTWRTENNGPEDERGEPQDSPVVRVETVLEAAERAAAEIRRDAQEWAERHMAEARLRADELVSQRVEELSGITDELLAVAQAVARQSEDLVRALDATRDRALRASLRRREDMGSNRREIEPAPRSVDPLDPIGSVSHGARLLATQMAVAGSNRETIAGRLRREFGVDDPGAILDEAGL